MAIKIHVEKALDGRAVYFTILSKNPSMAIAKFCTYCGSDKLTNGYLGAYGEDEIHCKNCGAHIHDCCVQHDYDSFKEFMKENKKDAD
jgi:hypothetical protein